MGRCCGEAVIALESVCQSGRGLGGRGSLNTHREIEKKDHKNEKKKSPSSSGGPRKERWWREVIIPLGRGCLSGRGLGGKYSLNTQGAKWGGKITKK